MTVSYTAGAKSLRPLVEVHLFYTIVIILYTFMPLQVILSE